MSSDTTPQSLAEPGITPTSEVPEPQCLLYRVLIGSGFSPPAYPRYSVDSELTRSYTKEGTKQDLLLSQERKSLGKGGLGHLNHIVLLLCVPPPQVVMLFSIKQGDTSVWSATRKKGEMIA